MSEHSKKLLTAGTADPNVGNGFLRMSWRIERSRAKKEGVEIIDEASERPGETWQNLIWRAGNDSTLRMIMNAMSPVITDPRFYGHITIRDFSLLSGDGLRLFVLTVYQFIFGTLSMLLDPGPITHPDVLALAAVLKLKTDAVPATASH